MKKQIVTLKTFLGTTKPKKNTLDRENYWKLIGVKGVIIDEHELNGPVLVLFNMNLDDLQLENHNPVKNSLWISTTDLEVVN